MATVNLTLFVNVTRRLLQASTTDGTSVPIPEFTYGDTYDLKVCLLEQTGTIRPAFTILPPGSLGLKVGIGVRGSSPLVLQDAFTPSGNYLVATLDCTPAGYASAIDAGTPLYLEIKAGDGNFKTVLQELCTNRRSVTTVTSVAPAPADSYRTASESDNTYVKRVGSAGQAITLTSEDGTKSGIIYWGNDNALHAEPIT